MGNIKKWIIKNIGDLFGVIGFFILFHVNWSIGIGVACVAISIVYLIEDNLSEINK